MNLVYQVSSVELERVVIASVPAVMEAAAVGLTPPGGGPEQLIMFLVLHQNASASSPTPEGSAASSSSQQSPSASQQKQDGLLYEQEQRSGQESSKPDGIASSLDTLWDAVGQVKSATAAAASRVTNMAAAVIQGKAGSSAGGSGSQQDPGLRNVESSQQAGGDGIHLQELKLKCQQAIRNSLNPLFKLERVLLRDSLPRTASNKVMRRLLRDELRQISAKL